MYILFDIGGTRTRITATTDGETFSQDPIVYDTPEDYCDAISALHKHTEALAGDTQIAGFCGGITGVLSPDNTKLASSPHHPSWVDKDLAHDIAHDTGAPVHLFNDTAMVGIGEAHKGAGQDAHILAYITISTGIGGVRLVQGVPDITHYGFEIGHHIVDHQRLTSYEDLASGTAIAARYHMEPKDILGKDIWEEEAQAVAVGLLNVMYFWSPDTIVLGGGMMKRSDQLTVEMIIPKLEKLNHLFPTIPTIKKASLGALGGLYGAMAYINRTS